MSDDDTTRIESVDETPSADATPVATRKRRLLHRNEGETSTLTAPAWVAAIGVLLIGISLLLGSLRQVHGGDRAEHRQHMKMMMRQGGGGPAMGGPRGGGPGMGMGMRGDGKGFRQKRMMGESGAAEEEAKSGTSTTKQ